MSPSRIQGLFKSRLTLLLDLTHISVDFPQNLQKSHPVDLLVSLRGIPEVIQSRAPQGCFLLIECHQKRFHCLISLGNVVSKLSQTLRYTNINYGFIKKVS